MRVGVLVLLATTACGRVHFDLSRDSGASDAPLDAALDVLDATSSPVPVLLQQATLMGNGTALVLAIAPTQSSSLLVVATNNFNVGGQAEALVSITDDAGNAYVDTATSATWDGLQGRVQIWYAASATAGATTVTLTSNNTTTREVWFYEVSGTGGSNLTGIMCANDRQNGPLAIAPLTMTTSANEFVTSVVLVAGSIQGIDPTSPFTNFAGATGDASAYLIAATAGLYGAVWSAPGSDIASSCTATFQAK